MKEIPFVRLRLWLLLFGLSLSFHSFGQMEAMDSIRQVIAVGSNDSVRIHALLDLGYLYELDLPDSALAIYKRAEEQSAVVDYAIGRAKALQYSGIVMHDQGEYYQAIRFYNKALYAYQKANSENGVATTYNNMGNSYLYLGDFKEAIRFYTYAQPFLEKQNRPEQLVVLMGNLGDCYRQLNDYSAMLSVARKSYFYATVLNDPSEIANAGITLGTALHLNGRSDSAFHYLNESLIKAESLNDPMLKYYAQMDLATIDKDRKDYAQALIRADSVMAMAELIQIDYLRIGALNLRGDCQMDAGRMDEAHAAFSAALDLAKKNGAMKLQQEAVDRLYRWYVKKGDLNKALSFRNQWVMLNDSLYNEDKAKQIALIRTIYETEEKEKMIAEEKAMSLEKDAKIRSRNSYLWGAAALLVVVLALAWGLLNRQRNKRRLAEQEVMLQAERNKSLEREKEVVQMRALIEGQEQERHRLGRELHDGLGGMLSAARMQLSQLRDQKNTTEPELKWSALDRLITESAKEMRTISHNLAPEGLDKLGLAESIRSFCLRVSTDELPIAFELHGDSWSPQVSNDIVIYRLIQELVNNAMKHARATSCFVVLSYMSDTLLVTVEDDGVGMDLRHISESKGMSNLRARISFLGGKFDLLSSLGKGTSINLTIPRYV
jgi:two-component system NarL family sensor kinase